MKRSSQSEVLRSNTSGFTLIELLVAVVVAGVLAAISMPLYQKTIERNYWRVAGDVLMTIYAGERAYFLNNGFYYDVNEGAANPMTEWRIISMDNPNIASILISYQVGTPATPFPPGPQTFLAGAIRQAGPCQTTLRTITQDRVDSGAGLVCWPGCTAC